MGLEKFLERFTIHLKHSIARAIALAAAMRHGEVTTLHFLLALMDERGSSGGEMLKRAGIDADLLRAAVSEQTWNVEAPNSLRGRATLPMPALHEETKEVLERAMMTAYDRGETAVGTKHLLLGILSLPGGLAKKFFTDARVDRQALKKQAESDASSETGEDEAAQAGDMRELMRELQDMTALLASETKDAATKKETEKKRKNAGHHQHQRLTAIEAFTADLTSRGAQKRLDPVIGRDEEIARLIHILCRRTKNNPVLVGEPGVGKTAIVEGLSRRIAEGRVPAALAGKMLLSLDLTLLVAGSIYRGEFEARLRQLIDEIAGRSDVILFIDELHNLVGAGANAGAMDAANMLKPALARGDLHCIGATTIDEYERYIGNDPALERRFQSITVEEPSEEDAERILSGIAARYEEFHAVRIEPAAIAAAVRLSARYVHDRMLPDKAIDLLDETAAAARAEARPRKRIQSKSKKTKWLRVGPDDVAAALSRRLRLAAGDIMNDDWERIRKLPTALKERVIGQDAVIDEISALISRAHMRRTDKDARPRASFLFAGPSGVGKTALARALAETLYGEVKALIKFDMAEFSEPHSVSKILGSPAGYVGHNERNRFTEEIRKRPHAVILFDEFDRAHADVQRLILQILDDGELADSRGKLLHFRHAIFILTTSVGAERYRSGEVGFGADRASAGGIGAANSAAIRSELREQFGSALLDRLHGVLLFAPFSAAAIESLIAREIADISAALQRSASLSIVPEKTVLRALAGECGKEGVGARHIARAVEKLVSDAVADVLGDSRRKAAYTLTKKKDRYCLV